MYHSYIPVILKLVLYLMSTKDYFFFYDDAVFNVHGMNKDCYMSSKRKLKMGTKNSVSLYLLMICSLSGVQAVQLLTKPPKKCDIKKFISNFFRSFWKERVKESQGLSNIKWSKPVLYSDNSTKNLGPEWAKFCEKESFTQIYGIPYFSGTNLCEHWFEATKAQVYQKFGYKKGPNIQEMHNFFSTSQVYDTQFRV